VPCGVWQKDWVVHCKPVGNGASALKYLAPYVYRVAITNNRIEKHENGQVSFRFKNSDTEKWESKSLPALDFIHRFLQHVLPKGFVKIRYYGFMAANKRNLIAVANYLLANTALAKDFKALKTNHTICPYCGSKLAWVKALPRSTRAPP
jgi:hypothetical protein